MITRKEMNEMARYISETNYSENTKKAMALMCICICEHSNPRFDEDRFLKACGVEL